MAIRNLPCVINLTNSIIGVGILAMPFCIQQCGVVLGLLMLTSSGLFTYSSCCLLMKAGVASQLKSYEYLALATHGPLGKLTVEIGMIGLQLGSCIAYSVVIGDLGPSIVSRILNIENSGWLRTMMMVFMVMCVAYPLALRRHLNSLSGISSLSLSFYAVFISFVLFTALPRLWSGHWVPHAYLWRPEGIFQCLPIFSLAFACQAQLFIIYDALPEPSLTSVTLVIRYAIYLCAGAYVSVGFFGYVAFADTHLTGDILTSFKPSFISNLMQLGFVASVALSFPLVIFPCRISIYTLCCRLKPRSHDSVEDTGIPDWHFNVITTLIVTSTLTIGILIPNVEFVLALCGSTTGCLVSFIMPSLLFMKVMSSSAESKILPRIILCLGATIMIVSTYTTILKQITPHTVDIKPLELPNVPVDLNVIKIRPPADKNPSAENVKLSHNFGRKQPVVPAAPIDGVIKKLSPSKKRVDNGTPVATVRVTEKKIIATPTPSIRGENTKDTTIAHAQQPVIPTKIIPNANISISTKTMLNIKKWPDFQPREFNSLKKSRHRSWVDKSSRIPLHIGQVKREQVTTVAGSLPKDSGLRK